MAGNPVVDDLIKGQKLTNELKKLLASPDPAGSPVGSLLEDISGSFSKAIAMMQSIGSCTFDPATPCSNEQESPSKRKLSQAARRGGYRRRANLSSSTKVLKRTIDDGYSWRKYGQKEIFSAKFPRSYFRCTHKFDQECQAMRQVQQSEEDPSMFEITYLGEHTCSQRAKPGDGTSSYVINFEPRPAPTEDQQVPPFSAPTRSIKHECDEAATSDPRLSDEFPSSDFLPLPELTNFDEFNVLSILQHDDGSFGADGHPFELDVLNLESAIWTD